MGEGAVGQVEDGAACLSHVFSALVGRGVPRPEVKGGQERGAVGEDAADQARAHCGELRKISVFGFLVELGGSAL